MPGKVPVAEQPLGLGGERSRVTWADACACLAVAQTYWLATVRPDGRPHVMPLLAVWTDDMLHFVASPATRKARNLAGRSGCVVTASGHALDLVVEGDAAKVRDEAVLRRVAEAYASRYGWRVTIREGAFYADGAPTAGPPPYDVYEVVPTTAFAFGTDEPFGATRWRF